MRAIGKNKLMGAVVLLAIVMNFTLALGQDTDPPVITLISPDDEAVIIINDDVDLEALIYDESPTTVWVYGGTDPDPSDLLYVGAGIQGTEGILHPWDALRLKNETGYTMGLWHLDYGSGSGFFDAGDNSNTGIIEGDAAWSTAGKFGYAIAFDGTDGGLSIPDHASLDIDSAEGALTVEAWIYPNSVGDGFATIVTKRSADGVNYQVSLNDTSDKLLFYSGHWPQVFISDVSIPIDTWSYIAVTVDVTAGFGDAIFYLNGVPADIIADTVVFGAANDIPVMIGNNDMDQGFNGLMDEVRLTSRALDASEIANNYGLKLGTYYWKVAADDGLNKHTNVSDIREFIIEELEVDVDAPDITLNAPGDGIYTNDHFMQLNTTLNDDSPPMSVLIYGGTSSDPQTLLMANANVSDNATLTFDWNAQRLTAGTGTMGLWHFDKYASTTVYDSSGNSNDGSFGGNASWTWDGRFGYAIDFDGTPSGLSIPDHASLDIDSVEGALTMEAWIYPNTVSNGYATILGKRLGSSTNYQISLNSTSDHLLFYSGHWPQVFVSDVSITPDTWSYIAVTVDVTSGAGDAIFYLNGVPADTISDTVVFGGANDVPLMIGSIDGWAQPFDGILDEVRLTDHVLSASDIAANYELGEGEYYWRVVAEDSEENSGTSDSRSFVITDVTCFPGEDNGTQPINILDITYMISFLYKGGPAPVPYPRCSGDPNCDCSVNILDATYLINYIYKSGPAPCNGLEWFEDCQI